MTDERIFRKVQCGQGRVRMAGMNRMIKLALRVTRDVNEVVALKAEGN